MPKDTSPWPFLIDYMPEECLQTAEKELHETPETKKQALAELNYKIKERRRSSFVEALFAAFDSNIKSDITFEPDHLVQFLRVSKFNVDKAFNRLKNYTNFRRKHPQFFTGVGDKISSNSSYSWITPLPHRSPDGCAIFVLKFGMWNINDIPYEDLQRLVLNCLLQALRNPVTQIKGFQVIHDFKGTTLKHLLYATPKNLLEVAQIYLDSSAARFKYFHCVNGTTAMKLAWAIMKPFLSEKLRNRVIFHKHPENVSNYIDGEVLPVEYGGELESYYDHEWLKEANNQMSKSTLRGQRNVF